LIKKKLLPFVLTAFVILIDQITKALVVRNLPYARPINVIGDFLRWTYVSNPAIGWSIGRNMGGGGRTILTMVLPLVVVAVLLYYYFTTKDITGGQRWIIAAIVGGGLGNYVDRVFRSGEVVDFIDVKFYGVFGLERWPVFNLADSTVVVAGITLLILFLITGVKKEK